MDESKAPVSLFQHAQEGISFLDTEGRYVSVNESYASIAGYRPEEMIGRNWEVTVHEDDRERLRQAYADMLRDGKVIAEARGLRKDGSVFYKRVSMISAHSDRGFIGHYCFMVDLTEIKRAEEKTRAIQQKLTEVQRFESLGILAGGVAHDFNNLLLIMLGNVGHAIEKLEGDVPAITPLRNVEAAGKRAAEIVQQLLVYAGGGQTRRRACDLNEIVAEMTRLLHVSLNRGVAVEYELEPELPEIIADPTQVRQVLMNLVTNASEALGEGGGVLTVSTGAVEVTREMLGYAYLSPEFEPGTHVALCVRDTGPGIPSEDVSRIFDPFYTTKFTGRGLGLAAVQGIVKGHRSAIRVESAPGAGTAFTVFLPASTTPSPSENGDPGANGSSRRKRGTVLVADDEPAVREVAEAVLSEWDYRVLTAEDGLAAIECFRKYDRRVDCIVLDVKMPRMSGIEALRRIRELDAAVPVILSSGYVGRDSLTAEVGAATTAFLPKPYTVGELRQALDDVISA